MKKSILKIGEALSKPEQKQVTGGNFGDPCFSTPIDQCFPFNGCQIFPCPDGSEYCGPASFHFSPCEP